MFGQFDSSSKLVALRSGQGLVAPAWDDRQAVHRMGALREGRLRISPHFYNRTEQVNRLLDALP